MLTEDGSLRPPSREKRGGSEGSGARGEQVWAVTVHSGAFTGHVGRPGVWRGHSENGQGGQCAPALALRVLCPGRPLSPTQTGVVGETGAKV